MTSLGWNCSKTFFHNSLRSQMVQQLEIYSKTPFLQHFSRFLAQKWAKHGFSSFSLFSLTPNPFLQNPRPYSAVEGKLRSSGGEDRDSRYLLAEMQTANILPNRCRRSLLVPIGGASSSRLTCVLPLLQNTIQSGRVPQASSFTSGDIQSFVHMSRQRKSVKVNAEYSRQDSSGYGRAPVGDR